MKKYVSCFLFLCPLMAFFLYTPFFLNHRTKYPVVTEKTIETAEETEAAEAADGVVDQAVVVAEEVQKNEAPGEYLLVSEEGYLLIYDSDRTTVRLITHMPVGDFPLREQELLMEGIWFGTLEDIFSYLESWTS